MKNKIYSLVSICIIAMFVLTSCTNYVQEQNLEYSTVQTDDIDSNAGFGFGELGAKITMIEYTSFECKDCANLHNNIGSKLHEYIDNGIIRYIFKPVTHPKFENDYEFNRRFVPEKYDDIDSIFSKYQEFKDKDLSTILNILNLDKINDNYDVMNNKINSELNNLDIHGTPTTIINGRSYSDESLTENNFIKIINELSKNES